MGNRTRKMLLLLVVEERESTPPIETTAEVIDEVTAVRPKAILAKCAPVIELAKRRVMR